MQCVYKCEVQIVLDLSPRFITEKDGVGQKGVDQKKYSNKNKVTGVRENHTNDNCPYMVHIRILTILLMYY